MKHFFALLLILSIGFGTISAAPESENPEMDALVSLGLLQGSESGMEPDRRVTRAEAVVMALRLCGVQPESEIPAFADLEGHWAADAVTYAYHQDYFFLLWNLTDMFEPEREVSGEELGRLLLRAISYVGLLRNAENARLVKDSQIRQLLSQVWRLTRKDACKIFYAALTSLTADGKPLYKQLCEMGILEEAVCNRMLGVSEKSFGVRLLEQLPGGKNTLLSPFGIRMTLSVAANGATGETRNQLLRLLGFSDIEACNDYMTSQLRLLSSHKACFASSIWTNLEQKRIGFNDSFLERMEKLYPLEAGVLQSGEELGQINAWAGELTEGSIRWVAGNDDFATLLTGLSYLSASWTEGFDPALTSPGDFITGWGDTMQTDFMHRTGMMDYYETQGCQAVRLNYDSTGQNGLSMYLLLSDHTVDLDAFFKEARFKQTPVDLRIPKFEAEYWRPLARNMEAFGVDCFTQKGPNFSGIFPRERLGFNEFYHTSLLRVNESGSGPQKTGFSPPDAETGAVPQVTFNANRPFVYAVRCSGSDELLFVGEYNKVPASPVKYW